MTPLISPEKVFELAFSPQDQLPVNAISTTRILASEERYIRPVVGDELFEAMCKGSYKELVEEFVGPVIAYGLRLGLLPQLRLSIAPRGVVEPSGEGWKAPAKETFHEARQALKSHLEDLRRRLDRELHRGHTQGEIPEYQPEKNVRNRCRIYGDFIQSF